MSLWMKCTTLRTNTGIDFEEILLDRKSCSVLRHHFFIIVEIGRIHSRTNQTNLVWYRFMGVNTGSGSRVDCSAAMSFSESCCVLIAPPKITIPWQVPFANMSCKNPSPLLICVGCAELTPPCITHSSPLGFIWNDFRQSKPDLFGLCVTPLMALMRVDWTHALVHSMWEKI